MALFNIFHPKKKRAAPPSPPKAKESSPAARVPTPGNPRARGAPPSAPVRSADAFWVPSCAEISPDILGAALLRKDPEVPRPKLEVFCAVKLVRVYCHSHILDKMSDLTKFIICSVAEGRTADDIIALTQLGGHAVEDETAYLRKGKLLEDGEELVLTPLGQEHFRLIRIFAELSKGIEAQLNLHTDRIEARPGRLYGQGELAPGAFLLNGKFSNVLLQNYNYSNSQEFVQPFLQGDTPFHGEILESLYTVVRLEKAGQSSVYQRLEVPCLYEFAHPGLVEGAICFALPVHEIHYRLQIYALDNYRSVLSTLDLLEQFEKQLLSDRSLLLVRRFREERDAPDHVVCGDLYGGSRCRDEWIVLPERPEGCFLVAPCYPNIQFGLEVNSSSIGKHYYLEESKRVPRYLCFSLPYDSLVREQGTTEPDPAR